MSRPPIENFLGMVLTQTTNYINAIQEQNTKGQKRRRLNIQTVLLR